MRSTRPLVVVLALLVGATLLRGQTFTPSRTSSPTIATNNGTAAAPAVTQASDPDNGIYWGTNQILFATAGTARWDISANGLCALTDTCLVRDAANVLALKNSTTAQEFRVYKTTTGPSYGNFLWAGNSFTIQTTNAGSENIVLNTLGAQSLSFSTANTGRWLMSGSTGSGAAGDLLTQTDGAVSIGNSNANRPGSLFLQAPAVTIGSGTGITLNNSGEVRQLVYKITVASTAFVCAAVTCDVTIATLPAKTFVSHSLADLVTTFACSATCTTATLSATLGKTAGGNQYLLSFDADAAAAQFGDAAAELGASLAPATTPTEIGDLAAWAATTAVVMRMTSGTGNIGNGAASNFSQGSVTFYLTTTKLP